MNPINILKNMNISVWITQLDEATQAFQHTFGHLSAAQLNWKPDAQTWSIAQNLHHLIVINESYYPVIESIRANQYKVPFMGKFRFFSSFLGNMILKAVRADRKRKTKTFPIWEPTQSQIEGDILEKFARHQVAFKEFMSQCQDLLEKETIISSPANRNITYSLAAAFDIIVSHEARHLEQAKEVLSMLDKPQH
jgi:uncharacterized damage-inducible protein DinB